MQSCANIDRALICLRIRQRRRVFVTKIDSYEKKLAVTIKAETATHPSRKHVNGLIKRRQHADTRLNLRRLIRWSIAHFRSVDGTGFAP